MNYKIASIVVTFNRKKLLLECLNSLRSQTHPPDAIFIVDGPSTDGTPESLLECGFIKKLPPTRHRGCSWETENTIYSPNGKPIKIHYIRIYKDVGGSGGFYEGVKRAYKAGYDWVWLMDDDAEPKEDALEKLVKYINLPSAAALACLKVDENGKFIGHRGRFNFRDPSKHIVKSIKEEDYENREYAEIDHASFVGILVSSKAIKKIGFPEKRFFIYCDDVEYCLRLRRVGKIYLIPSSIIVHKEEMKKNKSIKKQFLNRTLYRDPYEKFWKRYYEIRNLTYLWKIYSRNKLIFIVGLLKRYFRDIGKVILFDDHKLRRMLFVTLAYMDGVRGIFDNEKPKRILYRRDKK